ncbi:DNA alkylation repair enzyme [Lacticaseibacillus saniviri JCM 17471 = DSM 24301]|uniref:DNA alkylation repair enzyme n=2 Tax=Lacticaseibacillus saniviri TaxID=931533 RepID=A0A0R2MR08_9LACO|nr:DNA alkylation repair enzyme [Lacticaseibacillus saniviri JCM 17471 = DSM 24301]
MLMGNSDNAVTMATYMKHHFSFVGVKTPERKAQSKALLKASLTVPLPEVLSQIDGLWQREEREYQYVAIDMALINLRRWSLESLEQLVPYVNDKAWWDSVDAWRKLFQEYVKRHPEDRETVFEWFYGQDDFWLRRVGINLQLTAKADTDTAMLTKAILADQATDEFFIQKAIGWALRDYAKTDPEWVRQFIAGHPLSSLATREGGKYL